MQNKFVNNAQGNFTIVQNDLIECPSLSWKAKGLYIYMLSRPTGWVFNKRDLVKRSADGMGSVETAIAELKSLGLLCIERYRQAGKIAGALWTLQPFALPQPEFPVMALNTATTGNSSAGKTSAGELPPNNTNKINTDLKSKKDRESQDEIKQYFINFIRDKRIDDRGDVIKYPTKDFGLLAFDSKGRLVEYETGKKLSKPLAFDVYSYWFLHADIILQSLQAQLTLSKVENLECERILKELKNGRQEI